MKYIHFYQKYAKYALSIFYSKCYGSHKSTWYAQSSPMEENMTYHKNPSSIYYYYQYYVFFLMFYCVFFCVSGKRKFDFLLSLKNIQV